MQKLRWTPALDRPKREQKPILNRSHPLNAKLVLWTHGSQPIVDLTRNLAAAHTGTWTNTSRGRVPSYVAASSQKTTLAPLGTLTLPMSASFWLKQTTIGDYNVFGTHINPSLYVGVWFNTAVTGYFEFSFGDGGTPGADNRRTWVATSGQMAADSWYHIAFSIVDSTTGYAWVNGVPVTLTTSGSGATISMGTESAGIATAPGTVSYFNGEIDDLQIWNLTLLTGPQVLELYRSPWGTRNNPRLLVDPTVRWITPSEGATASPKSYSFADSLFNWQWEKM